MNNIIREVKVSINGKQVVLNKENNKVYVNTPTLSFNTDDNIAKGDRQTGARRLFMYDVKSLNEEGIALNTELNDLLNNLESDSVFGDYRVMVISNYKYRGLDRLKREGIWELLEYAEVLNMGIILHSPTEIDREIEDELISLEQFTEFINEDILNKEV